MTTSPDQPLPPSGPRTPPLAETVYAHLRAIAQNQMKGERTGHTLSATALVHEAYLRLGEGQQGRAGFVHAAAEAMRRILIEHARARGRIKRGGKAAKLSLDAIGDVADLASMDEDEGGEGMLAFDGAFERLEKDQPGIAEVVRLRFFAGLTVAETATVLGISPRTVDNHWAFARAWLARELEQAAAIQDQTDG